MRRLILLAVVVLVAAAIATPALAKGGKPNGVPFKADLGGDQVVLDFVVPPDRCPTVDGANVVTSFAGTGNATHLGRVTMEASHCTNLFTGVYGDGELMLTAANGDVLLATYTDGLTVPISLPDDLFAFSDTFTFTDGGTGRFTFASGGGVEEGIFNGAALEWSITMTGEVSYSRR